MNLDGLDLNIDNYKLDDILALFRIRAIDEPSLKLAKQAVHKTHPDKSHADPALFRFYTAAYRRLYTVYEHQNKAERAAPTGEALEQFLTERAAPIRMADENRTALGALFAQPDMKDPKNFNKWFNDEFNRRKSTIDGIGADLGVGGHGDWLKTDDGIDQDRRVIAQSEMGAEFERRKQKVQAMTVYTGIHDVWGGSSVGGSSLNESALDNFSSDPLSDGLQYQDIKQAFTENVIPVTDADFAKVRKFRSEKEYACHRDREMMRTVIPTEEECEAKLRQVAENEDRISAYTAYQYAKQLEESQRQDEQFWSRIKLLN